MWKGNGFAIQVQSIYGMESFDEDISYNIISILKQVHNKCEKLFNL